MLLKKETRQVSERDALETAVKDLAEVVASLHQLLQGYGPLWYTSETDARLRNAIAEADSALRRSSIQPRQYPDTRRKAAKELPKPPKKDNCTLPAARKVHPAPASLAL